MMTLFRKIKNNKLKMFIRSIYSLIPIEFREFDKEFYGFYYFLKKQEKKNIDDIKKYQFEKFKELVENAYEQSAFYNKKFRDSGFHPSQLKKYEDIKKVPILTKNELRENFNDIVINKSRGLKLVSTSGTTGKSVSYFVNNNVLKKELASIYYQWDRVGYKPGDIRAEFRGFIDTGELYIYYPDKRILKINISKMNSKNINIIVEKIKFYKIDFLVGYPSAMHKFALLLNKTNMQIYPKAIMLASEILYDFQITYLDKTFPETNKIIHYGQAELVALGAWLDNDRTYNFIPSYGIVEIDDDSSIIGTSLINDVSPIIRYKLSDKIRGYSDKNKDEKSTLFPVVEEILGRSEDYTYSYDMHIVPPALVTYPFKNIKSIESCKIIQKKYGEIELLVELNEKKIELFESEKKYLVGELVKVYGEKTDIIVNVVNNIEREKSGKFKWIECTIGEKSNVRNNRKNIEA